MADSKKKLTKAVAVATAAALLLGGTFAWQSISQTALNEASDVINPGGRLHDDFYIDADGNYNSDIYVENFADDEIFARVRLEEYFEIVTNKGLVGADGTLLETVHTVAGSKTLKDGAVADPVNNPTGANLYDYEYVTHYFDQENDTDEYWTLTPGDVDSETVYYMPTFNKNKDSLVPDRNGMYVDRVGGISDQSPSQYEDYYVWSDGEESIDNAIYDADSNDVDEYGNGDANQENWIEVEETHTAQAVGTSNGLISMSVWQDLLANDEPTGEYWVYDEDGWVYWTSPIAKDSATGLLLDSISLNKVMDDSWYYALNVIGQFVTANDLGSEEDGTGFYDTTDGPAPSDNALALLEAIGVDVSGDGNDNEEDPWEDPMEDGIITVDGKAPDEEGYIYLEGLNIDTNNSFDVLVSEEYGELVEGGLTAVFDEVGIVDTTMVVDPGNPYAATLTIAARDYHSVIIKAEFDDDSIETVTVVPVYNTLVITPDMDGETITLPAAYYSLRAEDFNGDVEYTITGAKRANIFEDNGEKYLSILSYESSEQFTLTTTDGENTAVVTIIVKNAHPHDGPIYTYYVIGEGETQSYALMETQEYSWEQNDAYTYEIRANMVNDYEGVIEWKIVDGTTEDSVYFVDEEGNKIDTTFTGRNPRIKFTDAQINSFRLEATIYVDQEKNTVMTDEEGRAYDGNYQYFTIYPTKTGNPVIKYLMVGHEYEYTHINLAPEESAEVKFYAHLRDEDKVVTNEDMTWSLVQAEEGCTFTIEEGDAEEITATVTHTCDSDSCTGVGGVQVKVTYDHAYGLEAISEFYVVAEEYNGDLDLSVPGEEPFDSGNLELNYSEEDPDKIWSSGETVTFSIDDHDNSDFDWEILDGGVYAVDGQPGTFVHYEEGTDEWNACPCTTVIKATLIDDPSVWGAVQIECA